MQIFDNKANINVNDININYFDPSKTIFFDIETTGFSPKACTLYLIGCMYLKDTEFYLKMFFIDNINEEPTLLKAFFDFISNYDNLINFNGDGFDIPFILDKCKLYDLQYNFDSLRSIDLYKIISPLKYLLKLENHKQKTIEKFLGIERDDKYSGGELINIYHEYVKSNDRNHLALLILHNMEDVKGLISLLSMTSYLSIVNGEFTVSSFEINAYRSIEGLEKKEVIIDLELDDKIPKRISSGYKEFYFSAFGKTVKLKAEMYTDELKFFYPNYKDYFYLPIEDAAVHKSVAFYVDKNFRTQAKAATCYSKKTGRFLPQYDEIISPYFKIDYNDRTSYFEITDEFMEDKALIKSYCIHIINILCKKLPV